MLLESLTIPLIYIHLGSFYKAILKEYSVILTTSFYDINKKILTKRVIFKTSVDSNFAIALLHKLLS